ncbi:MAG: type IV pilus secretin PilQ, partial [Pontixanthobacter sp.]
NEKSLSRMLGRYFGPKLQQHFQRAPILFLVAVCLLSAAGTAGAAGVLKNVSFQPMPGSVVDVALELDSASADAKIFATSDPPRIAIDLPDTSNQFKERMLSIGTGAAKAVTAVEAGGRTRVVIDLFRSAPYESRREGKTLVIRIQNGFADVIATKAPTDPAKAVVSASVTELTSIDFRRGKAGEGRLILGFSGDNANANLREEGGRLLLDLPNVSIPARFQKKLDVVDFATPVESIDARAQGGGTRMTFITGAEYEKLAYQAGSEYVVEIAPKRIEPKKRLATDPPVYSGNRVTFNFQDIPVRSVLQLVADVSELNIVVADTVQGNVTLRLVNVPWDQALDIILQAKGLDKRRNGSVIWVAPTKEIAEREQALEDARIAMEDRAEVVVDYISISYGKAEDLAKLLTTDILENKGSGGGTNTQTQSRGVLSQRGSVSFDERTNTLIVTDIPERVEKVRTLIAMLDKPVRQVLIESRIVIAQEGFRKQLGARFGISGANEDGDGNLITIGGTLGATDQMVGLGLSNRLSGASSALPVGLGDPTGGGVVAPSALNRLKFNLPVASPGAGSFATTILGADYILDMELSALESEDRGELLSSPKVITADQQEAVIKQGQEVGYVTLQSSGGGVPTATVAFKEIVLELLVTPRITADGRVFLALKVKKDNLSGFITTPGGQVPIIDKREVQTGALVDNGQTVVLGGIYEFERNDTLTKVPVLGDIPAIGNLFRNKDRQNSKVELLIFVTPKILVDSK